MSAANYVASVMAASPRAFYTLQDAPDTLPQDSSGNGLHMTTENVATGNFQRTGPFGSDYAIKLVPGGSMFRAQVTNVGDNLTIEFICKVLVNPSISSDTGPVGNQSAGNGWSVWIGTTRQLGGICQNVGFWPQSFSSLPFDEYVYVAIRKASGTWTYQINDVVDAQSFGMAIATSANQFAIATGNALEVDMAYTAIYETARPREELMNRAYIFKNVRGGQIRIPQTPVVQSHLM